MKCNVYMICTLRMTSYIYALMQDLFLSFTFWNVCIPSTNSLHLQTSIGSVQCTGQKTCVSDYVMLWRWALLDCFCVENFAMHVCCTTDRQSRQCIKTKRDDWIGTWNFGSIFSYNDDVVMWCEMWWW